MEAYPVLVTILLQFVAATESTNFTITNNCPYTVWPATQGNANSPSSVVTTGFALNQGASSIITTPSNWKGRLWARTFCGTNSSGGGFVCATGDCGSGKIPCNGNSGDTPITLAEFQLSGSGNDDFYDVSLIDGFNLPVSISRGGCPTVSCPVDINAICPSNLTVRLSNGGVVGCRIDPSLFKSQCPQALALPQDTNTLTCPTGGDYIITFCPSSSGQPSFSVQGPQYLGMLCIP